MTPEETKLLRVAQYQDRHRYRFGLSVPAVILLAHVPQRWRWAQRAKARIEVWVWGERITEDLW